MKIKLRQHRGHIVNISFYHSTSMASRALLIKKKIHLKDVSSWTPSKLSILCLEVRQSRFLLSDCRFGQKVASFLIKNFGNGGNSIKDAEAVNEVHALIHKEKSGLWFPDALYSNSFTLIALRDCEKTDKQHFFNLQQKTFQQSIRNF